MLVEKALEYKNQVASRGIVEVVFDWDGRYPWSRCEEETALGDRVLRFRN